MSTGSSLPDSVYISKLRSVLEKATVNLFQDNTSNKELDSSGFR